MRTCRQQGGKWVFEEGQILIHERYIGVGRREFTFEIEGPSHWPVRVDERYFDLADPEGRTRSKREFPGTICVAGEMLRKVSDDDYEFFCDAALYLRDGELWRSEILRTWLRMVRRRFSTWLIFSLHIFNLADVRAGTLPSWSDVKPIRWLKGA